MSLDACIGSDDDSGCQWWWENYFQLSSDDSSVLWLCCLRIASFLFWYVTPNIILHASWLLLLNPSQLRVVVMIAMLHLKPAAVQPPHLLLAIAILIKPYMTNAWRRWMAVMLSSLKLRTLTLTLKEPLWTKPKGVGDSHVLCGYVRWGEEWG